MKKVGLQYTTAGELIAAQEEIENKAPSCSKCQYRAMDIGYIPDRGLTLFPMSWFKGYAKKGYIFRVQIRHGGEYAPVVTFRCPKCGYLENYAPDVEG